MYRENRTDSEAELIQRLSQSPDSAMEELVERYSGPVRTAAERFLDNPEDVNECVNDTFMEFYRSRERYDGERGSLGVYLTAIAKKLAISRFRKNAARPSVELPEDVPGRGDPIGDMERRADLEQAISQMSPEDAELIRRKYYDGMTLREIADAGGIPYETVKKRHQRSLGKLKILLITVLSLLAAALLAACAYAVLRHIGLLPGYGMSSGSGGPVYLLAAEASADGELWTYTVKEAVLLEDTLNIRVAVQFWDESGAREQWEAMTEQYRAAQIAQLSGGLQSAGFRKSSYGASTSYDSGIMITLPFENSRQVLDGTESVELTLSLYEVEIPIAMQCIKPENPENYRYALGGEGGVLAIPRQEDGVLSVELYPLNTGAYEVTADLIWGAYRQGRMQDITLTGENEERLVGKMAYTPYSDQFSVWEFGTVEPGDYVLHVPYIYLQYEIPFMEAYQIDLDLEACEWEDRVMELPFGTAKILSCQKQDLELQPGDLAWKVVVQFDTDMELSAPPLRVMAGGRLISQTCTALPAGCYMLPVYVPEGEVDLTQARLSLSGTVSLLWNQELTIPFTVE